MRRRRTMQASIEIYPALIITITTDSGEQKVTPVALTSMGEVLRVLVLMLLRWIGSGFAPLKKTPRWVDPVTKKVARPLGRIVKGLRAEGLGAMTFSWIMGRSFVWATVGV